MLAPFVIDLLIGCLIILVAGWANDVIHASAFAGRRSNPSRHERPTIVRARH